MGGVSPENGNVNVLAYPEKFEPGKLLSIRFRRIGSGDLNLKFKPLRGDNYFAFGEDVRFEIGIVTGVKNEESAIPKEFALSQNYPNPFNPSTKISFAIPKVGNATLKIYDLLGKEVVTLVEGEMSPGNHEVIFDASGLPSGIYVYRLTSGGFTDIKRMILLK